ncbi:MAG: peptidylprolyl isomerase [Pegethrix bostrychoides GSE-TBD4-15B]|uniref:Peptidylprolyl isomerase n=1 Tax=Pegethrix bostrychoides GSE-TBD4-15B TaxID=2839662 RepID=A0A951P7H4_9CYAN|nr:peptidylprolyl isomerase [Pegethrix bostrychoides GSE-TBD4-15B]
MAQPHPPQIPPQILRRLILDQAIADIECSEFEREQIQQQFDPAQARQQMWQEEVSPTDVADWLSREVRIRKFQRRQWGKTLTSYFLQRKDQLDQVICSLIYLRDIAFAQELYFRIIEGEQSFAELATLYSQQQHASEPTALGDLPPKLARMFYGGRVGQVWAPTLIEQQIVIARLEAHLPMQLDAAMQQRLYNERLEQWLNRQLQQQFGVL